MRVCLIIPPSQFLLDERVFLSLGMLKVAASLEQADHRVDVLDLSGEADYLRKVDEYVSSHPDVHRYGITATTPQMPAAMKIASRIPWWTILGGPHATLVHAAYKNEIKRGVKDGRACRALDKLLEEFPVVVAGDGERAIHTAISSDSPALIDADDPNSMDGMFLASMTQSPWPARHLVDMNSYHYEIEGKRSTSIISQTGCPFGCNFCGGRLSPMLRRMRLRDADDVLREMEWLYKHMGYTGFMFYDDELNVNPRLIDLLRGIYDLQERLKVQFRLRGFVKAELFTEEQAQWMYIAGFRWLLCGFESGNERILKNINKRATRADNTRMLAIARQAGIKVKALMSLGHPGESRQTIRDTREWLLEERPDDFDATVITVYPGSPYYDSAVEGPAGVWRFETGGDKLYYRDVDFTQDAAFYKGVPGDYKSYVWTDYLTSEELVRERDELEEEVRRGLGVPYPSRQARAHEQSMGQTKEMIRGRG